MTCLHFKRSNIVREKASDPSTSRRWAQREIYYLVYHLSTFTHSAGAYEKALFFLAVRPVSLPPANQIELLFCQHIVNALSIQFIFYIWIRVSHKCRNISNKTLSVSIQFVYAIKSFPFINVYPSFITLHITYWPLDYISLSLTLPSV